MGAKQMGEFLTFIVILAVIMVGMLTLIFRMMAAAEAKELRKDPLRPPVEVRFRPKAFLVLVAGIVAGCLFIVLAVVLGRDREVPSYVFGVGLVILISVLKPILGSKVGKPFGVAKVGAEADVLPVATAPAPLYPGQHTAPLLTTDGRPFLPPNTGGVPQSGQYQSGQYPSDPYQTGQYPSGPYMSDQFQPGQPGQYAPGQYPSGYYMPEGHAPDVDGGAPRN